MDANSRNITTSSGGSDIPQEITSQGEQGSHAGSNNDPKTANVPAQALVGTHVSVQRCAQTTRKQDQEGDSERNGKDRGGCESVGSQPHDAQSGNSAASQGRAGPQAKSRGSAPPDAVDAITKVSMSVRSLKSSITTQDGGLNLLFQKADTLEVYAEKSRSPAIKEAVEELLAVVKGLKGSRESVVRAFNALLTSTMALETSSKNPPDDSSRGVGVSCQTDEVALSASPATRTTRIQTPCWWGTDGPTQGQAGRGKRPAAGVNADAGKASKKRSRQQQKQQQQLKQPPKQPTQRLPKQQQQQQKQEQQGQPSTQRQDTWSEVVRRRKKDPSNSPAPPVRRPSANGKLALLRQRAPKTAAVTIDRPAGGGSLAAVMKKVAGSIDLGALGVKVLTTRRTRAGGILLEVVGEGKAAELESRIREVCGDSARVRRPERKTPVLLLNVPEWAGVEEVVTGLASAGTVVAANAVSLRSNGGRRGGLDRVARVDLPVRDAIALAEHRAVQVCWTKCRVKLLERRQPTCYRCQQKGHHAAECRGEAKPRSCYGCGSNDHLARDCQGKRSSSSSSGSSRSGSSRGAEGEAKERSAAGGPSRPAGRTATTTAVGPDPAP